jgi:hypothetical protein
VKPITNPDPYMMNKFDEADAVKRFLYMDRVCQLANYLFRLRDETGFDILIKRFRSNRDMRSVNLEAMIASFFKKQEFSIKILPQTMIRGLDFDFTATRGSEKINVEVTGCTNERFSAGNIKNILEKKRDQLPDSDPALLYIILPQEWVSDSPNLQTKIEEETVRFYKRSQTGRLNAVVYMMSQMKRVGAGAAFLDIYSPVFNTRARHEIELSFLVEDGAGARETAEKINSGELGQYAKLSSLSYWTIIQNVREPRIDA